MSANEIIYTDGACSANGTRNAKGGFGMFIARSSIFNAPLKINRKGEQMGNLYVTNIRMEGLAIIATLALYANVLVDNNLNDDDPVARLNSFDPFDINGLKLQYSDGELKAFKTIPSYIIEIVTDSQFWINVIEKWMPGWLRKGIVLEKKNPDILLMFIHYMEKLKQNGIQIVFTHVKSHQKGKRTAHADGNDVADVLATSSAANSTTEFYKQA